MPVPFDEVTQLIPQAKILEDTAEQIADYLVPQKLEQSVKAVKGSKERVQQRTGTASNVPSSEHRKSRSASCAALARILDQATGAAESSRGAPRKAQECAENGERDHHRDGDKA